MLKWDDLARMAAKLSGLPVLGCLADGAADVAGVRYGDILLSVNGVPTPDWHAYLQACAHDRDTMRVTLFRAGETLAFELALGPAPSWTAAGGGTDAPALLQALIEHGSFPYSSGEPRREPDPS